MNRKYELEGELKICKSFEDLNGMETSLFKIGRNELYGNMWMNCKDFDKISEEDCGMLYLSTHMFREDCYKEYEKMLRDFGFNIELEKEEDKLGGM